MVWSRWMPVVGAVVLGTALAVAQQQQSNSGAAQSNSNASQQPAPRRSPRLTRPWNQLTDLSDDLKGKIIGIHSKANAEVNAIRTKEHEEILALLSDPQKKEVADIEAQDRTRNRRGSTTRPSASAQQSR